MILPSELRTIARARLKDAEVLLAAGRYDGSVYLCGYSVELGLKARICRTLKWSTFPLTKNEFRDYNTFKTHEFDVLLHLSGAEVRIKTKHFKEWSVVMKWRPEHRYRPIGTATVGDATDLINSAKAILGAL